MSLTHDEIARYSRHLLLPEVGLEGQERLKAASAVVIGAGGLGSPLLLYLAAAGVGRIGVIDPDVVDASNLQRQVLHGSSTVGRAKVEVARDRVQDLNPLVQLDLYGEALTADNALRLLAPYDVVIDGTDNFPTRYLANDACELLGKPLVYGSVFRFEGQVSVFHHEGGPTYRDLYPEPPPPGMVPNCAEGGVLGVLPGVIGTLQATEALKVLLGIGETLSGRLLVYDALQMQFRTLRLARDPSRPPVTALIDYEQFCGVPAHDRAVADATGPEVPWRRWSAREVAAARAEGWSPFVLDVRQPHEAAIAALPFADALIPHREVARRVAELPTEGELLVHCRAGSRSTSAIEALLAAGVAPDRIVELADGLLGWAADVDPSLATY